MILISGPLLSGVGMVDSEIRNYANAKLSTPCHPTIAFIDMEY